MQRWEEKKLNRQLFSIDSIPPESNEAIPDQTKFDAISISLSKREVSAFDLDCIGRWFQRRSAQAGQKKGRSLFLNKFLKHVVVAKRGMELFFKCLCSAQTKTSVDYCVMLHASMGEEPGIRQASCQCAAGMGMSAACKHVSALAHLIEHYGITGYYLFLHVIA